MKWRDIFHTVNISLNCKICVLYNFGSFFIDVKFLSSIPLLLARQRGCLYSLGKSCHNSLRPTISRSLWSWRQEKIQEARTLRGPGDQWRYPVERHVTIHECSPAIQNFTSLHSKYLWFHEVICNVYFVYCFRGSSYVKLSKFDVQ